MAFVRLGEGGLLPVGSVQRERYRPSTLPGAVPYLLVAAVLSFVVGCGRGEPPADTWSSTLPLKVAGEKPRPLAERIEEGVRRSGVEILDEPGSSAAWNAALRREQRDREAFEQCLGAKSCWSDALRWQRGRFEAYPDLAVPFLRGLIRAGDLTLEGRSAATWLLMRLGASEAKMAWSALLNAGGEQSAAALAVAAEGPPGVGDEQPGELDALLARLLRESRPGLLKPLLYLDAPRLWGERACAALESRVDPGPEARERANGVLLDQCASPAAARFWLSFYREGNEPDYRGRRRIDRAMTLLPRQERRGHVEWMIGRHLKANGDGGFLPAICRWAAVEDVAFLERVLETGGASDKKRVLEALFRLGHGKEAAFELLQQERRGPVRSAALSHLRKAHGGREDTALARRVLALAGDSPSGIEPFAYTALVIGGRSMLPEVRTVYARAGANRLFSLRMQWYLRGITLADVVGDFQAAGIVPAGDVRRAIADELEANAYWQGEENPGMLRFVLERLNGVVSFDAESGFFPVDNRRVIRWLSGAGQAPLPVRRIHQEAEAYPDGYTAKYTVLWQIGERVYTVQFEDDVDWYALGALVPALNFSAAQEGREERFVAMDTGDQSAAYLFGVPERIEALAKRYGLSGFGI